MLLETDTHKDMNNHSASLARRPVRAVPRRRRRLVIDNHVFIYLL